MQGWSVFYATLAAAAASLLGLLFVAVSINAAEVLGPGREDSRRLAEQAFQNYLTVLLISLMTLIPDMHAIPLGIITIWVTALWTVLVLGRLWQSVRAHGRGELGPQSLRRHLTSLIGFLLLIYAAVRMAMGHDDNRNLFSSALVVLLSSATIVSWELLLRVGKAGIKP